MKTPKAAENPNPVLAAAEDCIRRGWPILPLRPVRGGNCSCRKGAKCESPGKHPLTRNGLKDATKDPEKLREWLAQSPDCNVAVATGPASGVWVLDIDAPEAEDLLERLQGCYGALPKTPVVRTRRGRHLYFKWPKTTVIRSKVQIHGYSLDTRGEGGYAVLPPSRAPEHEYRWEVSPDDVNPPYAPDWLIDFITSKKPSAAMSTLLAGDKGGVSADLAGHQPVSGVQSGVGAVTTGRRRVFHVEEDLDLTTAEGVAEGSRHDRALRLVGAHLGRGEEPEKISEQALAWAARCDPPMPEDEVLRIVKDLSAKQETAAGGADADWPPPIPFAEHDLPPFPTDALPSWLQEYVDAEAVATQTPADLPAMLVLSMVAASLAKKVEVSIKKGYVEPLNLFTVTALGPANRKSAVFSHVTMPILDYERETADELKPKRAEIELLRGIDEGRLVKLKTAVAKAEMAEREGLLKEAGELAQALAKATVPAVPRLVADDSTPEKLASLLHENDGRMAVMSPEGGVFEIMGGRYTSGGVPNLDVYLKGHAGDDLRVDRVGRPAEFVHRPALTLGLAVQPDVLYGLADKPGFRGRGLLARFLYSLPRSLVGSRDVDPPSVPPLVQATYHESILELLRLSPDTDESGRPRPYQLRLSEEARQARLEFERELEPQLAPGSALGAIADWAGKLAGAMTRIAALLHLAEHVRSKRPWETSISGAVMANAVRIARYLIPHARAAFSEMGTDPVVEDARYVLVWINRNGVTSFTERDVFEGTKGRFRRVEVLRTALILLINHHFISQRPAPARQGPGRPPSPTYNVNPLTRSHYSRNSQNSPPAEDSANCANTTTPPGALTGGENVSGAALAEYEEGSL